MQSYTICERTLPLLKVPTLRPFFLLARATCKWREWRFGEVTLIGRNRITRRRTCSSTTSSTSNLTLTLRCRSRAFAISDPRLTPWTMVRPSRLVFLYCIYNYSVHTSQRTLRIHYIDQSFSVVNRNNRDVLWEPYEIRKYTVWMKRIVSWC
jgi:hypothetical protein